MVDGKVYKEHGQIHETRLDSSMVCSDVTKQRQRGTTAREDDGEVRDIRSQRVKTVTGG